MQKESPADDARHQLSVSAWNLRGGLSDPARASRIADGLTSSQTDIHILPDAWHADSSRSHPTGRGLIVSANDFAANGYDVIDADFEEDRTDDNYARYHFTALIKQSLDYTSRTLDIGRRPAICISTFVGATALDIVGLHLNDQSEINRQQQVGALLDNISSEHPTILAGDFNALSRDTRIARLLSRSTIRKIAGQLNYANETLPRLVEIATGDTIDRLEAAGFMDTDPDHKPTAPSRSPLLQLDRFMHRNLPAHNFAIIPTIIELRSDLSDHRRISILIHTTDII